MIALCVEDKPLVLANLVRAVESSPYITEAVAFEDEVEALAWAEQHSFDAAFLDIELHVMTGLEVAKRLAEKNKSAFFVFCTGYREYALDAIRLHLRIGYILKPIEPEVVVREIAGLVQGQAAARPLSVRCFGRFEAYLGGRPMQFRRRKAKELLAFLVDCRGSFVNTNEICAALWESENDKKAYLRQLLLELRHKFAEAGAPELLLSGRDSYAIDAGQIDCDYYRFLAGERETPFQGKYMAGYSWAEETCAWLLAHAD